MYSKTSKDLKYPIGLLLRLSLQQQRASNSSNFHYHCNEINQQVINGLISCPAGGMNTPSSIYSNLAHMVKFTANFDIWKKYNFIRYHFRFC